MGEVFAGRYELLSPIASGGMGTVWVVHDHADGRVKGAKILKQSDAASLLRFVREQSVRIEHPHVVTPDSWAGMDDRVLFTMPLVRGGSVGSLLGDFGALPLRWVGVLLEQTLAALEAVHAAGVVHRDVKPANLLLEPTGTGRPHLRLTDFGIAAPLGEPRMTRPSMSIGSPGYMAPEQLQGADPDPRQDVYAVGMVGLEMLAGAKPSLAGLAPEVAVLPEPRDRAARLLEVLHTAVSLDPAARWGSAAQLREQVEQLALGTLPADPDDTVEVLDHWSSWTADLPGAAAGAPAAGGTRPAPAPPLAPSGAGRSPVDALPAVLLMALGTLCFALAGLLALG